MRSIFPSLSKTCLELLDSNPKFIDKDLLNEFAIKAFMESMFGVEIVKEHEKEIFSNAKKMFKPTNWQFTQQVFLTYFPKLSDFFKLTFMPKWLDNYFRYVVETIIDQRSQLTTERNDYTQVLLQMRNAQKLNIYNRENKKIKQTFSKTTLYKTNNLYLKILFKYF